ncbi:Trp biosynthesis-associated membrane protein [Agromyces sp. SYSU T00194]|uniref:Trp biosynthesis-associated membrane protein n=1 Tax=Agromyces chitinivorans TaxID=3158560 RepID=UPI0033973653
MTARRRKLVIVVAVIGAAGLGLLAWTQDWFTVTLDAGDAHAVPGQVADAALAALALAGLALGAALAIAGRVARLVLGLLAVVLGACVVLSAALAMGDPAAAAAPVVTAATGIAGSSAAGLVASVAWSAWPWVAVASGVLLAAAGVAVLATSSRWPDSSRRYRAVRLERADGSAAGAVDEWDELSRGEDPTEPGRD